MISILYPTLEEALELHEMLIKRFGGQAGVRDLGLLQSALFRPQTGYYDSLSLQAAALLQSLITNHPFLDGNKRMAFALTAVFLQMNGWRLIAKADAAERFLLKNVIANKAEIGEIAHWLEKRIQSI